MDKISVAILVFDDVEPLDFIGPYEVLLRTYALNTEKQLFEIFTVAPTKQPVICFGGLQILPDEDFSTDRSYEYLFVPGGLGARSLNKEDPIVEFVRNAEEKIEQLVTICTGSYIAALTGNYSDVIMTTHHQRYEDFQYKFPSITLTMNKKYHDEPSLLSAGGISSGIDATLYFVNKLFGEAVAEQTAKILEYPFII